MAVQVKHSDLSNHQLPKTHWQMLGKLKLRADLNPKGTIRAWLMNILGDVSLPSDLVRRLLASIEEATVRMLSPDSIERPFENLEIVVLVPAGQASKGHTWGFFRVEKASTDSQIESAKGYCVEYYLYLDKKTG